MEFLSLTLHIVDCIIMSNSIDPIPSKANRILLLNFLIKSVWWCHKLQNIFANGIFLRITLIVLFSQFWSPQIGQSACKIHAAKDGPFNLHNIIYIGIALCCYYSGWIMFDYFLHITILVESQTRIRFAVYKMIAIAAVRDTE